MVSTASVQPDHMADELKSAISSHDDAVVQVQGHPWTHLVSEDRNTDTAFVIDSGMVDLGLEHDLSFFCNTTR